MRKFAGITAGVLIAVVAGGFFSGGANAAANDMVVTGPVAAGYRRAFFSKGEVFEMRLPSRGYYRELQPPIPVDVLEGRIKGKLAKPIAGYVPKPGVKYVSVRPPAASEAPEERAGGVADCAAGRLHRNQHQQ